jgi:hypothetical protein
MIAPEDVVLKRARGGLDGTLARPGEEDNVS